MPRLLLDHALKVHFLKLMFAFHECTFCPIGTTLVNHFSPTVIVTMALKRVASKEISERSNREAVEKASVKFPICVEIQLFIKKDSTLTWHQVQQ